MSPNAKRMQAAIDFVRDNPGATTRMVIAHVLAETSATLQRDETPLLDSRDAKRYKQAASVVERIIKDRHVRQATNQTLHPWDEKRKTFAEALERAMFAAPTPGQYEEMRELVCKAWLGAGDAGRARTIGGLKREA